MPTKYPWDTGSTAAPKQTATKIVYPWDAQPSVSQQSKPAETQLSTAVKKGKDLDWGEQPNPNKPKQPQMVSGVTTNRGTPVFFNATKFNKGTATAGKVVGVVANEALRTANALNSLIQAPATIGIAGSEEYKKEGTKGLFKGYLQGAKDTLKGENAATNSQFIEYVAPETTAKLKQSHPEAYKVGSEVLNFVGIDDVLGLGAVTNAAKVAKLKALPETTKALIKASEKDLASISAKVKSGTVLTEQETNLLNTIRKDLSIDNLGGKVEVKKGVEPPTLLDKVRKDLNINQNQTIQERFKSPTIKPAIADNINTLPVKENTAKTATALPNDLLNDATYKELTSELQGVKLSPDDNIKAAATLIKDKSGLSLNLKDVYRNMRDIFGKSYDHVKANYLDPFDKGKKAYVDEVKNYTDTIYKSVVKDLGINKGSKESAAVQNFGEGLITKEELVKQFGTDKANKIVAANDIFRKTYDELIDKVNATVKQIYPNNPDKLVPKRQDYYRHFKEMSEGFEGLKNIFETPSAIDPKLAGMSEFTKPNTKWASFKQKRGNGDYTADAVGGFLEYIQPAAYSIHIDPHISKFRGLAKDIAEGTADTKNANNVIKYLNDFSNSLAGKTNKYDRVIQEDIPGGRTAFRAINWVNGRVKANQVLMNAQSAVSQFANVPVGIARVKDPVAITKGVGQTLAGVVGKGNKALKESQFINERYMNGLISRFDKKLINQPKKLAAWLLEGADKLGTTFTWNSAYNKALAEGINEPVKYADDMARSIVAGRGIGEVPLWQQAKRNQLIAPFQLEVANLWHVMGDQLKEKDFGGISMLMLGNYLFNNVTENLTGNRVTFDPINAMFEALQEENSNIGTVAGRTAGEVLSNVPLGQTIAAQYPEFGADISTPFGDVSLPSRKKLFGDEDPTRFGGGLLVTKAATDPLYKLVLPFGGSQLKKTIEGNQAVNKGMVIKKGKLQYPVANTTGNRIKGTLFGKYGVNEAREYFDKDRRPLSEKQTAELLKKPNLKGNYEKLMSNRRINTLEDKIAAIRKDPELTKEEKNEKIALLQKQLMQITSK